MSGLQFFCRDYTSARKLFLASCERAGISVESYKHPYPGPSGESLYTDCTLIGSKNARNLVVLVSGTHGVETFCGSACQSGFIAEGQHKAVDNDTAFLVVHALNCWGAAYLRRNNEDNVDLNRNFLRFKEPLPENPAYEKIHSAISCAEYRGNERDIANDKLADYIAEHGINKYVSAVMGGQYTHADGMAYGGDRPVWSNKLLATVLAPFDGTVEKLRIVEYHSGLGPYGYGMAVTMQTGTELKLVRSIYGNWTEAPNESGPGADEKYLQVQGHTTDGYRAALPDAEMTAIVLEYGTYPPNVSLPVLLDDHWLTMHGDGESKEAHDIKERLLEMHHPSDADWYTAVWDRSGQVIDQTLRSLY